MSVIHDDSQTSVPVHIIDNKDNTFTVELTPPATGSYTTNLHYGGLKVPLSPKVFINPVADVSKIKVDGLEPSEYNDIGLASCSVIGLLYILSFSSNPM